MIFEVTDIPRRRLQVKPAHLATACVAGGLAFGAHAQQAGPGPGGSPPAAARLAAALASAAHAQQPEPGPGETPPAADVREGPWDPMGEPDQLNASDIANAVGEAEGEVDGGLPAAAA